MFLDSITKVDFSSINIFKGCSFKPAFLYLKKRKQLLKVDRWQDTMKILFFIIYQTSDGKRIIDRWTDKISPFTHGYLISKEKEKVSETIGVTLTEPVKFSSEPDVRYLKVATNSGYPYNNLRIIQGLFDDEKIPSFELYVCSNKLDGSSDAFATFLKDQKKKRRKPISCSYLLSHINKTILNKEELLFLRIEREFHEHAFIGDITTNEEEMEVVKKYLIQKTEKLVNNQEDTRCDFIYVYGLILFAQRRYKDGVFWPVLGEILGYTPAPPVQTKILAIGKNTLTSANKYYLEDGTTNKSQNLCMHSFVTTPAANDLFDYLFSFWKIDLERNIENLHGDDGKDVFDILIESIKQNKSGKPVNGLLVHTSLALLVNPIGSKNRLRYYLKLIDQWFWDENSLRTFHSENRILSLMKKWASNPNRAFQKSFKGREGGAFVKGAKMHSKPILHCVLRDGKFYLSLQRQLLKEIPQSDIHWTVTTKSGVQNKTPELIKNGKLGCYSEENYVPICEQDIFDKIIFSLSDTNRVYYQGNIKENEIRLFDENGKSVDLENGFVQKGKYIIFSLDGRISISGKHITLTKANSFYMGSVKLEDGDLIITSKGRAYPIGRNVQEGLIGELDESIYVENEEKQYPVYTHSPSYLLKIDESYLNGCYMKHNEENYRLSSIKLENICFKNGALDSSAFLLDLSQFPLKDGLNRFLIGLVGNVKREITFFLLKDFKFSFINAPYIFATTGILAFSKNPYIDTGVGCFERLSGEERFLFSLDEKNPSNEDCVKNKRIKFPISCNGFHGDICFKIPALYWGYDKNEITNFDKPHDISLKSIPENLYISNQFPHLIQKMEFEDSDLIINPEQVGEKDCVKLKIGFLKSESEIDKGRDKRALTLYYENKAIHFMDVLMKSIVKSYMIFGDFINNTIQGDCIIEGDGPYSATIYDENERPIAEDVPVENGHFECELDKLSNIYKIQFFEIVANGFGFDGVTIPLLKELHLLRLVDITHLKRAEIIDVQKKVFKPINFKKPIKYILNDFKKVEIKEILSEDIDITGVQEDIGSLSEDYSLAYTCSLFSKIYETLRFVCNCMLIFPNRNVASHYYLLREDVNNYGIDYEEMILDFVNGTLLPRESERMPLKEKLNHLQYLFLSDWQLHIKF